MPDLLIELFSEEIPARMQARAADDLKRLITDGIVDAGLTYAHAAGFATPRRLTLAIEGMLDASPATVEERKGPRADAPEKAIGGFLRGAGLTRDQLETRETPKGDILFARIEKPGRAAAEIVAAVLDQTIRQFPWPKSMRWGSGSLKWVRPLHSILCIMTDDSGATTVPLDVDGIRSGNVTQGHRFMSPDAFSVVSFEDYQAKLKRAFVVLDAAERREAIWHDATTQAFARGLEAVEDAGLLAEVAGLVEWPVVLMGRIGDAYLALPPEVLQTSMREHQKFFSVRNPKTGRIERFITVANRETADDGATILAGNEKVLSARLADAKFFWENDLRTVEREGMKAWTDRLADVTFHAKLGSQADRIDRITALSREIAPFVGAKPDLAAEAARIAKADLASEMVYEFPELQGTMGMYYARAAGHDDGVPEACAAHYAPLGPSDDVPTHPVSVAVALADKIDTLTGFWAIDEKPTGSKDPFALRRAALGVIRSLYENDVSLSLLELIKNDLNEVAVWGAAARGAALRENRSDGTKVITNLSKALVLGDTHGGFGEPRKKALKAFDEGSSDLVYVNETEKRFPSKSELIEHYAHDLLSFFYDRLKVYLRDQGIRHDVIDACIAMPGNDDLTLLVKRARALSETLKTDDGENLIQGFKRANNILSQAEEADGVEYSYGADVKFAESGEEKTLFRALDEAEAIINPAMEREDFTTAMAAMAALRGPIDAFFDAVQINTDNQTLRRNRLNLLSRIRAICTSVADLTRLEG